MEYTAPDIEAITGLSGRQLHYLIEHGVLEPQPSEGRGSGYHFRFDEQEACVAAAAASARHLGMSSEILALFAARLRQTPAALWTSSVLVLPDGTVRSKEDGEIRHATGWSINLHEARATVHNTL